MTPPAIAIPNLLHRYAELIDAADFEGAAALFDHGGVVAEGVRIEGREAIAGMWRSWIKLHDGSPRTRHIITNPIIELSEDGQSAQCRSQWTVLQAAPGLPLQVIATGRYHDRFAVIEGEWRFAERRYAGFDLMGDMSAHLKRTLEDEDA